MQKQPFPMRLWNIIYPIFIYYVVSNVAMYLLILALGITQEEYAARYMMLQTLGTAASLPFVYGFYKRDKLMFAVFHQRTSHAFKEVGEKEKLITALLVAICGMFAGLALNHIIAAAGLAELSVGYRNVTNHFFAGGLFFEVLGVGILIPIAEELLYRGIVYARLSDWLGIPKAALVSSVIFAGLHMNLVQLIYAFFMGLLMVFFLEKTYHLYGAALGHIGANLTTVLRVETGCLDWMESSPVVYWISTMAMAAVSVGILFFFKRKRA